MKLYLKNPYIKEISANVLEKMYIKNKYYLKLDRTIFIPRESGSIPNSKGFISNSKLLDIYEDKGQIIHVIAEDIVDNSVTLKLDLSLRLNVLQQYTSYIILKSSLKRLYNIEVQNFSITETSSQIIIPKKDFNISYMDKIETYINRVISFNFPIETKYYDNSRILINIPSENTVLSKIPVLRNTGEISLFKFTKLRESKDHVEIDYISGQRAILDYNKKSKLSQEISSILNVDEALILEEIKNLLKIDEKQ